MINIKRGGQHRIVPDYKLKYWLGLGFQVVEQEKTKEPDIDERETLQAELDALGIEYDGRWGVDKLKEVLEGAE